MTCLPFGLATAPDAFASLSNWIAEYLRSLGIRIVVYSDDFLLACQNRKLLVEQGRKSIEVLQFLGWRINFVKSWLPPQVELEFLGITWNPSDNFKFISQEKKQKLKKSIRKILNKKKWSWGMSASILGELNFVAFVVPLCRLHCRKIQRACSCLPRAQGFVWNNSEGSGRTRVVAGDNSSGFTHFSRKPPGVHYN